MSFAQLDSDEQGLGARGALMLPVFCKRRPWMVPA